MILFEDLEILLGESLEVDVGQIRLLTEIYRENHVLLKKHLFNRSLVARLLDLVMREGRQLRVLKFFSVFMQCDGRYMFDNQLLLLN